jgi:tetratricopeptide (TPR) repeat protein
MEDRFLSRFTPSLMSPDALEAIFVQREGLLHDILERVKTSVLGSERKNTLLVGPRGIGKTHLISLTYHRLRSMSALRDRLLIAWLREEEWGIACFRDLLLRILRALVAEDEAKLRYIYSLPPSEAEAAALKLINGLVGDRTLVILVENLDDLVRKLGGPGEMQFFNFLRQSPSCVVATSPGPAARVFMPASPFRRDFFQVQPLKELDFETAIQLISKIAEYQGNAKLMFLLTTPRGRARVRALRYLAGGNHRAYVIFAPLLTHESIDQLIQPLMQTIDVLTPYYNSRIAVLPWEQRQILEYICEARCAVRTGDITRTCFLPRSAASAQLESLCTMGHLHALRIGNDIYYELREPLLRLSFEVKKHRGKPLGLLLDFLRLWYSPEELKQKLSSPGNARLEQPYIPDLEAVGQNWDDPRISECCRDYTEAVHKGDIEQALKFAEDLVSIRGLMQDRIAQASCLARLGRYDRALAVSDHVINSGNADASIWRLRASILNGAGRYEEALSSCRKSLDLDSNSCEALNCEASILLNLGQNEEALYCCEAALKLNESDSAAWATLGTVLAGIDLFDESFRAFSKVVELEPRNMHARMHLCAALIEMSRWDEALEQAKAIVDANPNGPEPWVLIGSVLAGIGEKEDALTAFEKAASMGEDSAYVRFKVVEILFALGRWRNAVAHLDQALQRFACSDSPITGDTKTLIRSLLSCLSDAGTLALLIKVLLLTYRKYGVLGALAQGLIVCIPDVAVSDTISNNEASAWLDSWGMIAAEYSEFRLPLRLLSAAIAYRNTRDTGVMIRLSQEERTLLEALVGVQVEAIA